MRRCQREDCNRWMPRHMRFDAKYCGLQCSRIAHKDTQLARQGKPKSKRRKRVAA